MVALVQMAPLSKGKVESGVHYHKRNFMAGRAYTNELLDIHAANRDVMIWVETVAGLQNFPSSFCKP